MALIELAEADGQDALDDYVEAQVHGPVRPDRDVEALVLDPKVWHCLARFGWANHGCRTARPLSSAAAGRGLMGGAQWTRGIVP
jgi:transposase